ncbi:hypothetical protein JZ751_013417, partial [Albula glossodonta]
MCSSRKIICSLLLLSVLEIGLGISSIALGAVGISRVRAEHKPQQGDASPVWSGVCFLLCGLCGVLCAQKRTGLIRNVSERGHSLTERNVSERGHSLTERNVSERGHSLTERNVSERGHSLTERNVSERGHSLTGRNRGHSLTERNVSERGHSLTERNVSERGHSLTERNVSERGHSLTERNVSERGHSLTERNMILFSACCICGLIGGILNLQFVRALVKRPQAHRPLHLVAMALACLGIVCSTLCTWLTCRLASSEQQRMFLEREHSLHHSHQMAEK